MPEPKEGESREKFISRCISFMVDEHPDMKHDQRIAICYSYWEKKDESTVVPQAVLDKLPENYSEIIEKHQSELEGFLDERG